MLTKLEIRNFKRFDSVEIELGSPVVFIGPNNSGKTTALQALALWDLGLKRWHEKRGDSETPGKRPGVAINRRDFLAAPIPEVKLLWRDLRVRDSRRDNGQHVCLEIVVHGVTKGREWKCGLEFDYANEESFYCRPLRLTDGKNGERMPVPSESSAVRIAFLPPLSGLEEQEFVKRPGQIAYLIGQGRTAEVLRNLCYSITQEPGGMERWNSICSQMSRMFGIALNLPDLLERDEIVMSYVDRSGVTLDLSCAGRGVHQTLLLLAYLEANPATTLLLDEPDAHLEILRQRQIYQTLCDLAESHGSQVVAASHSEVVLEEAAGRDVVVAFVGTPHRIDGKDQALKSLESIGFEDYYQAEETGWVLYLEGATDLAILRALADVLRHAAAADLARPFTRFIGNLPSNGWEHFYGLREAKPDLTGFLLVDRLETPKKLRSDDRLSQRMWRRNEIENYLCQPRSLRAYADRFAAGAETVMDDCIRELIPPLAYQDPSDSWWIDTKVSEAFLDRLFERFFKKLGIANLMRKTNYHQLARFVAVDDIDPEVIDVLDAIHDVASRARPRV